MTTKRDNVMEQEANLFAMLLLMPTKLIEEDLKNSIDLGDKTALRELAKKYEVPENAMAVRIGYYLKHKM